MKFVTKLERLRGDKRKLQEENKKLNAEIKELNETLKRETARCEIIEKECEKLKTVYSESIKSAREMGEKYKELHHECMTLKKQFLKDVKQFKE